MILSRDSRVLVSVLDWGLGHAGRSSVVVRTLLRRGCKVTLAGSGKSLDLLASEFPDLEVVSLRSFSPRLGGMRCLWMEVLLQVPSFLWSILREHRETVSLVRRLSPDLIVSDNRYGVWSRSCASVFMTHQLHPHVAPGAPKWVERCVSAVLCLMVKRFDACLVPDVRIGGLSGDMSSPAPAGVPFHCVGLLSRLSFATGARVGRVDWLGVASGPEPQRSRFISYLVRRFGALGGRRVVVCGGPSPVVCGAEAGVEVVTLADAGVMRGLLLSAEHVVCRSGYTTVMDLAALGLLDGRVEFIPTDGQAEQVYLAQRLANGLPTEIKSGTSGWLRKGASRDA